MRLPKFSPLRALAALAARRSWWVVGFWLLLTAVLNVVAPQLEQSASEKSAAIVPAELPAAQALVKMSNDFKSPPSTAVGSIVLASDRGFGEPEQRYYSQLVTRLLADRDHVAYVLDMYGNPATRSYAQSPDGKAVTLMVAEQGDIGTARAHEATQAIRAITSEIPRPAELQVELSGPAPIVVDEFSAMETSMLIITAVSVVLITILLVASYRSIAAAMVPLLTIGIALAASRAVVSALGWNGVLPISSLTVTLMTALVLAAGTDYAIFQVAAFHEARRRGESPLRAVVSGGHSVGEVLTASALTVAASASALIFAKVGMFTTAGPPIAIGLIVTLLVSLTFTPALIAILGRRGLIEPRPPRERAWRRRGVRILRRAGAVTAVAVLALLALATPALGYTPNGDDNAMQLRDTGSSSGIDLVGRHYPANELVPEYLVFRSDHDLRNTDDLAALDRAAAAVADLPNVAYVRAITRPDGKQLPQAAIGYQTSLIGGQLGDAHNRLDAARPDLERLAAGVTALHDGATDAQRQLPQLVDGTDQVVTLANSVVDLLPMATRLANATAADGRPLAQVLDDLQTLTGTLDTVLRTVEKNRNALMSLQSALAPFSAASAPASCDQQCGIGRELFAQLDRATGGSLRDALSTADAVAAIPPDTADTINGLLPQLRTGLDSLGTLVDSLGGRSPESIRADLQRLQDGMTALSAGVGQLADGLGQAKAGTDTTVGLTQQLSDGLGQAADYLKTLGQHTSAGAGAGFYLPESALRDDRFVSGSRLLLSDDGHVARMIVVSSINPYSPPAIESVGDIVATAKGSLKGSSLAATEVSSTGASSITSDLIRQVGKDFGLFAVVAVVAVFLILLVLLRSLLASVLLVATVLLSFATAAGLSVLLWQHIIGIGLHWSVLPVSFMALVAVGADYSMLFASRVREASGSGTTKGILRAFGTTGSIITTAGVVFAVTMFSLMTGSVILLLQTGFMIGVGLLLDIAVVRTLLVPAALHLLGDAVWWPSGRNRSPAAARNRLSK